MRRIRDELMKGERKESMVMRGAKGVFLNRSLRVE